MILEVDFDLLLQLIGGYVIGLLVGILVGWVLHRGRDLKKIIALLGTPGKQSPQKKDSGLALLEAIAEKNVPDKTPLEVGFIKQWITAELNKK